MYKESCEVLLSARAGAYRSLQTLLGNEPHPETLLKFASPETYEVLSLFDDEGGEYLQALNDLRSILQENAVSLEFIDKLSVGFTRLFVGPTTLEASPWESLYLGKEGVLFQASTLEVRKAYVKQGLIPAEYPHVADDHIALELDFMAQLADLAAQAYTEGRMDEVTQRLNAAKDFLDQHLLVWVPAFAAKLEQAKHAYFFADVGRMLKAFLPIDALAIDEILGSL